MVKDPAPPPKSEPPSLVETLVFMRSTMTFVRNTGVVVVLVAVCGAVAIAALFGRLGDLRQTQEDGIVRGYKNRTPMCVALMLSSSSKLPDVCTEDPVLPYVCKAAAQTNPAWVPRIEAQVGKPCSFPRE